MDKKSGVALTLVGLAVLAGVALATGGSGLNASDSPSDQPTTSVETTRDGDGVGLAVAESGPTCLDETTASRSGWVHLSGSGENAAVSFDLTVADEYGRDAETRLAKLGSGEYVLRITTDESDTGTADPATSGEVGECESVFRLQGSGLVPDVETLRVTVNGETIHTIENRDSFAELRELPEPVTPGNATAA